MSNRKVHIRANKLTGTNAPKALCASRQIGNGLVIYNGRNTYANMGSEIVSIRDAAKLPRETVCAHCEVIALERRNAERKANGKAPVADWREGFTE